MRKDLNMRKGKMVAQGAHASIAFLTNTIRESQKLSKKSLILPPAQQVWVNSAFTKICVGVDSEEELLAIHNKALEAGLVSHLITDSGFTEFGGVPTNTCCAIGPDYNENIDEICGSLKLL